jgi:heme/copper-type cytochrome/quinol oxidase subunit 3
MTEIVPDKAEVVLAETELQAQNISTATRLFVAADAFLFLGFVFAYLYLRTLDNNGMWNPPGQNPSGPMGVAVLVLVVVAAAVLHLASGRIGAGGPAAFRAPAAAALAIAVAATVLCAVQLFRPGLSPSHAGGLGSVFVGFTATYLVHLFGGLYWLETLVVQQPNDRLRGGAPACLLFWWSLAVVLAIFSVLFYLV